MQNILDSILDNVEPDVTMTEEEAILDSELRSIMNEEVLEKYLKLIDLLMSSRATAEIRQYKNGFVDALRLEKEIEDIKKAPIK